MSLNDEISCTYQEIRRLRRVWQLTHIALITYCIFIIGNLINLHFLSERTSVLINGISLGMVGACAIWIYTILGSSKIEYENAVSHLTVLEQIRSQYRWKVKTEEKENHS